MPDAIPRPRSFPFVGNLFEMDGAAVTQGLARLSEQLGPIYRLDILGNETIVLGGQRYVHEACDESRFGKRVHTALEQLRPALGDGLFTAYSHEPNWGLAHRILMPALGPLGVRGMFDRMLDIARQMFDRWERFGEDAIDVPDTMTRLTLDTLALCAFDYRLNSFYRDTMHPFVDAMVGTLLEAGARDRRPAFVNRAMIGRRRRFARDIAEMHAMADSLLANRRAEGEAGRRGDLLDTMLTGRDPVTGAALDPENIRLQLMTFLIAGHETTSGLLSFAVHLLLDNPGVMESARAAVDAVIGDRDPTIEDLARLALIDDILNETLRLWPTAPAFAVSPHAPTTLCGHPVMPDDEILILLPALHRDRTVWGDNADRFDPNRFADGAVDRLPPDSFKPFGNGARACIGRSFAMQEAKLVLVMLLQRFEITRADPGYQLSVVETLTVKPDGLVIRARRRTPPPMALPARMPSTEPIVAPPRATDTEMPMLILHGGNAGSSAFFARRLHADALARGLPSRLMSLDEASGAIPEGATVLIVTASYEGEPPDNARRFVPWIESQQDKALAGRRFAVLGCGNRQWVRTYQAIPKRVDLAFERAGAARLIARGEADAAGDFEADASAWIAELWALLDGADSPNSAAEVSASALVIEPPTPARLSAGPTVVTRCLRNIRLTDDALGIGTKHHIELQLPPGQSWRTGDYLAITPSNPPIIVTRLLARLGLDPELSVRKQAETVLPGLPEGTAWPLKLVLADLVDLGQPASTRQISLLARFAQCPPERAALDALASIPIQSDGPSLLDLLDRFPTCAVPPAELIAALPPMAPRRYSIASSARRSDARCALTVSVVDRQGRDGVPSHLGAASNYLAALPENATLGVALLSGDDRFRPPTNETVPMVMICAGSGIAPFRGFIEDRAIARSQGARPGPALLLFGCRHPAGDSLYADELAQWQAEGLVEVHTSFSRQPVNGARYVQDLIRLEAKRIVELVRSGGHVYVCGDARALVPAVEEALIDICVNALACPRPLALRWARRHLLSTGRYAVDAFA